MGATVSCLCIKWARRGQGNISSLFIASLLADHGSALARLALRTESPFRIICLVSEIVNQMTGQAHTAPRLIFYELMKIPFK